MIAHEILSRANTHHSLDNGDWHKDPRDPLNLRILEERMQAYNTIIGPRVGDFVILPDGKYDRFTYVWPDGIQTGGANGSFYLGQSFMSYSGGLDPAMNFSDIRQVNGESRMGSVWFFHHNHYCAHNAVEYKVPFRVFLIVTKKPNDDEEMSERPWEHY